MDQPWLPDSTEQVLFQRCRRSRIARYLPVKNGGKVVSS